MQVSNRIKAVNKIGLLSILKSHRVYSKGKGYENGRSLRNFLINGNTSIETGKNFRIINKGIFNLGIDPHDAFLPSSKHCALSMHENSKLVINGTVSAGPGVKITIYENAVLDIGDGVFINSDTKLLCSKSIKIGNGSVIAWDVEIRDTDYHRIIGEGEKPSEVIKPVSHVWTGRPIEIGNHVWIGSRATINKGVRIGDGSVVATGTIVAKDVPDNCLVAGVPGKVIRENVRWE